jgi:hypothetical protein
MINEARWQLFMAGIRKSGAPSHPYDELASRKPHELLAKASLQA